MIKTCSKCKETKNTTEFSKHKSSKDGLRSYCKLCNSVYCKSYRIKNMDKERIRDRNREENNRDRRKLARTIRYGKNKEYTAVQSKTWRTNNKEYIKAQSKTWRGNNRGKLNAAASKRRAKKLQATPKWLTKEHWKEIEGFYVLAAKLTKDSNPHHVDHQVPLQGESVSGLHVPWNLQLLPAKENISKGNRL